MICPSCGSENEAGRKFCGECGARLALACPACGSPNSPGAKFCGECGVTLGAKEAQAEPTVAVPVAERRIVSVLFADLVGFTTLSESRDAEDVRELLSSYFDACREVMDRYGGVIEKFIGDAVMAVWGAPVAHEDDAERAVRAALDLVDVVHRLRENAELPDLGLRAGVLTGEAAVTLGATNQGMVAGDLVNTASRLQSVAPPGTVLVGEATQRATAEAIAYEPAGEQLLKGKAAPVPAFRALRVIGKRGGAGRSGQLEPPFVGRDAELRLVKDFYHATSRERGVRLVSVIGQGGIGKSRLAWEFLKYIDGVTELVYWHEGRSPAYGDGISFWALGEMVRMRAGIGEADDEATTRERLAATLDEFVPDAEERKTLEGPLLQLLGLEEGQGRERGQLFAAWRTFFERLADDAPVALVFEDLQWADDGLLDFIEELLAWSRGHPIYIISLSRPELLDRRPTWGAGHRSFTSLNLAPIADDDMRALLAGLVPGLPHAVSERIVRRAEGIPLYAVETVRMLLDEGRIERTDDAYRPVGDLTELAIPESLHALIAARIDALSPAERGLLQDASVLGLSFGVPALRAVTQVAADELDSMLRRLAQRELVVLDDDPRSPERGNFRFVQALLRDVAYGTLAKRDRRTRHLAAARYYEALGDDELAGVLAQHYLDAYRAQPEGDEGAAVAAQARLALRGAAQRARELGSPRGAGAHLALAIEVATDAAEELELRAEAGWLMGMAGLFDESIAHLERAIALATELEDAAAHRRATAQLAQIYTEGHLERARELLTEAMEEPGLTPEDPGFLDLAEALAKVEMRTSNDAAAVAMADLALPAAAAAGDERVAVELLVTRGVSLSNLNRPIEANVTLMGALALAERRGFTDAFLRASINLGYVLEPEDPRQAFDVSRRGAEHARRLGITWGLRYLLGNAADGAVQVGEWDWAMDQLREEMERDPEPAENLFFSGLMTTIRAYRGEPVEEEALALAATATEFDDPQYTILGNWALGVYRLVHGELEELLTLVERMLALGFQGIEDAQTGARAHIWRRDAAGARRMLDVYRTGRQGRRQTAAIRTIEGGIAFLEGRTAEATALYTDATRLWRELDLTLGLALCQLDIVELGALDPAERRRAADEVRAFAERVGARPLIERVDAALAAQQPEPAPAYADEIGVPTGQPA